MTLIYEESPNGPLANQTMNGEPVLACNWGFGIEDGKPYFDTGMASPGQQAHLELVGSLRIAIVTPVRLFGFGLLGAPLPANPAARACRVDVPGLPRGPLSFAERPRVLTRDRQSLNANPVSHAVQRPLMPANPPSRGLAGRMAVSPNAPNRAWLADRLPLGANPRRPSAGCGEGCGETAVLGGLCSRHYLRRKVRR